MKEEKISYKGVCLTGSFSPATMNWLEEYNSLPEEIQALINFEPAELTRAVMQHTNVLTRNTPDTVYDAGQYTANGGLVFDPEFWNSANKIARANCYAHAMNVTVQNEGEKLQPGEIRGVGIELKMSIEDITKELIQAAIQDAASGGMGLITGIRPFTVGEILKKNEYRVAFVVAPAENNPERFLDYHWYRENSDGVWSHKPGSTAARFLDSSANVIDANNLPEQCNRRYRYLDKRDNKVHEFNYSIFAGYYVVTHS